MNEAAAATAPTPTGQRVGAGHAGIGSRRAGAAVSTCARTDGAGRGRHGAWRFASVGAGRRCGAALTSGTAIGPQPRPCTEPHRRIEHDHAARAAASTTRRGPIHPPMATTAGRVDPRIDLDLHATDQGDRPAAIAARPHRSGDRGATPVASFRICNPPMSYVGCCLADGTSWQEIVPDFFQPSRSSQVLGWYTMQVATQRRATAVQARKW
jgi:hypothetical protein